MDMVLHAAPLLILGLLAGTLSGLLGIGGGVIIIPILVFVFGLTQHEAQGTTLALMVPPIGLLAAWTYYKHGHVNVGMAALICLGFFFGGLLGARLASVISGVLLKRLFGIALLITALKMILAK
ncbi:MAG: TSUP family transporter [Sedimentisphaerales bacterium]|nr:TSUP family transporter [Sedimentisphaerales bacterium]